ncbi:Protein of unknown function, partial [Gryllus bimaculatus]
MIGEYADEHWQESDHVKEIEIWNQEKDVLGMNVHKMIDNLSSRGGDPEECLIHFLVKCSKDLRDGCCRDVVRVLLVLRFALHPFVEGGGGGGGGGSSVPVFTSTPSLPISLAGRRSMRYMQRTYQRNWQFWQRGCNSVNGSGYRNGDENNGKWILYEILEYVMCQRDDRIGGGAVRGECAEGAERAGNAQVREGKARRNDDPAGMMIPTDDPAGRGITAETARGGRNESALEGCRYEPHITTQLFGLVLNFTMIVSFLKGTAYLDQGHAHFLEVVGRADAGAQQDGRRVDGARAQNHLLGGRHLVLQAVVDVAHPARARALQHQRGDVAARPQEEVGAAARLAQVACVGRPARAVPRGGLDAVHAQLLARVVVVGRGEARLASAPQEQLAH